jgi:hypothetical protein
MNFDTGVMRFSSPSMGAWAATGSTGSMRVSRVRATRAKRVIHFLL